MYEPLLAGIHKLSLIDVTIVIGVSSLQVGHVRRSLIVA